LRVHCCFLAFSIADLCILVGIRLKRFNFAGIKEEKMRYFSKYIGTTRNSLVFRRWSRKKYGILVSLGRHIRIGVLCVAYSLVNRLTVVHAQADSGLVQTSVQEIEEVEVAGHRSQSAFSSLSRVVTVVGAAEIEKAGVQSVADLLEYVSHVDIRQRGFFGVQSDISIRGSSFDHVMVLINGVNMSDPQTGHASMDMPVEPEAIERVEILDGPAARTLGAGAFAGAVNIVTRRVQGNNVSAGISAGAYGLLRAHAQATLSGEKYGVFTSVANSVSDGYAEDTDFRIRNAYLRARYSEGEYMADFQAGWQDKRFGAAGYYSPRFPNQYEETEMWFASLRASAGNKVRISPVAYWRHRSDHFILERSSPEFYQNFHLTDILGLQMNIAWRTGAVFHTVGVDLRSENIISTNLGFPMANPVPVRGQDSLFFTLQYGRTNYAWFQEHNFQAGRWHFSGGIMLNWNSSYPTKPSLFPGLDISYSARPKVRIYTSVNRSLHLPTFTDLFYTDPVNQGNTTLRANQMVALEGGIKAGDADASIALAAFYNSGKDLIDWVWSYESLRFSPVNLIRFRVNGIETSISRSFSMGGDPIGKLSLYYAYMDIQKSIDDSVSKYNHLRHKLSMVLLHRLPGKVEAQWTISWQDRSGERIEYAEDGTGYYATPYSPFWLVDCTISRNWRMLRMFVAVTNLLNSSYADAGSAIQPGRWFRAGISVSFTGTEKK
jgi:iron complex outermembrane receptor protein